MSALDTLTHQRAYPLPYLTEMSAHVSSALESGGHVASVGEGLTEAGRAVAAARQMYGLCAKEGSVHSVGVSAFAFQGKQLC